MTTHLSLTTHPLNPPLLDEKEKMKIKSGPEMAKIHNILLDFSYLSIVLFNFWATCIFGDIFHFFCVTLFCFICQKFISFHFFVFSVGLCFDNKFIDQMFLKLVTKYQRIFELCCKTKWEENIQSNLLFFEHKIFIWHTLKILFIITFTPGGVTKWLCGGAGYLMRGDVLWAWVGWEFVM